MEHITTTTDPAVIEELIKLASSHAELAQEARTAGLKDEAKSFQRTANAFTGAIEEYTKGARPAELPGGAYLLPSRSNGVAHLVRCDGDWTCTCAAGASAHWAMALVIAVAAVEQRRIDAAAMKRRIGLARAQADIDELFPR